MSAVAPPSTARRRSWLPVLLPILLLSVVALVAVTHTLPYYAIGPAAARPVDRLINAPAELVFPHTGAFLFTSVNLKEATALDALRAWRDPDVEMVPFHRLTGVKPTGDARRQFQADLDTSMRISQHVAVAVALRRLGLPAEAGRDVRIDAGGVNGGSAGLALTLGLLDLFGSAQLTGGHRVAVTGTIGADGRVGDVDALPQKVAGARAAHAEYFLVPSAGFAVAAAHAGHRMKVMPVASLDDALAALAAIGGDVGSPRTERQP